MKVMVVDDEEDIISEVRLLLEPEGIEVVGATSGEEALGMLMEARPDFIFLDIIMPGMDGWETLKEIRKRSSVPVAMLTVIPLMESIGREELEEEIVDYVAKPFSKEDLIEVLRQVSGRGESESSKFFLN